MQMCDDYNMIGCEARVEPALGQRATRAFILPFRATPLFRYVCFEFLAQGLRLLSPSFCVKSNGGKRCSCSSAWIPRVPINKTKQILSQYC